jgi:hypothetical protein
VVLSRESRSSEKPATQAPVARCPPPPELNKEVPTLKHIGGSQSDILNGYFANQAMRSDWYGSERALVEVAEQRSAVLAFLAGVNPQDTIEGMMAAQLLASHAAAMECYRRAAPPQQSMEGRDMNLSHAAKLARANAAQVEALAKYRNKGQQKIVIEHVHVYQGGQAIVGSVTSGEGVDRIGAVQPHAIGHATSPPVWCQDPERQALPVAGNAKRSLPDARRTVAGRA